MVGSYRAVLAVLLLAGVDGARKRRVNTTASEANNSGNWYVEVGRGCCVEPRIGNHGGGGFSPSSCASLCDGVSGCTGFHLRTENGWCKIFTRCTSVARDQASCGEDTSGDWRGYTRAPMSFKYVETGKGCCASSKSTQIGGYGGAGFMLSSCSSLCDGISGCTGFHYRTDNGWCRIFDQCFMASQDFSSCGSNTGGWTAYAQEAFGRWDLVSSNANGGLEYQYTTSVTKENGQVITVTNSAEFTLTISAGFSFLGVSGSTQASTTTSRSVATSTSSTISRTSSHAHTQKCEFNPSLGSKVSLYRWLVGVHGSYVMSDNFRCHYTAGDFEAPECPVGFCGNNNPLCQLANCKSWSA